MFILKKQKIENFIQENILFFKQWDITCGVIRWAKSDYPADSVKY